MTTYRFTVSGADQIVDRFRGIRGRAADCRPVWNILERRFVRAEAIQFSSQGHGTWAPLSPDYASWKADHYPGKQILQATGDLFHSLIDDLAISVKEPSFAIFGTDDPKARLHQDGTNRMPARPVIDLSDEERRIWAQTVRDWIVDSATEAAAA